LITNSAFIDILQILREAFPPANTLRRTYHEAKAVIDKLGLGYISIHVFIKNCILFRKEYADFDNCPKCGESRWKNVEAKKTPQKVLRHFPLITRLQRKKSPNEARWNKLYRKPKVGKDLGEMSHPADGEAWEAFDKN
jgi:ssDNA-binding Zn-finger/Zn-ribbon topoisomerase 1